MHALRAFGNFFRMHPCEKVRNSELSNLCLAEAPAKHVVQIAKAFARHCPDGDSAVSTIARARLNDAEKAMQKAMVKFELTLNVPLSHIDLGGVTIPWLKPSDYLQTLNSRGFLHRVVGCSLESSSLAKLST